MLCLVLRLVEPNGQRLLIHDDPEISSGGELMASVKCAAQEGVTQQNYSVDGARADAHVKLASALTGNKAFIVWLGLPKCLLSRLCKRMQLRRPLNRNRNLTFVLSLFQQSNSVCLSDFRWLVLRRMDDQVDVVTLPFLQRRKRRLAHVLAVLQLGPIPQRRCWNSVFDADFPNRHIGDAEFLRNMRDRLFPYQLIEISAFHRLGASSLVSN